MYYFSRRAIGNIGNITLKQLPQVQNNSFETRRHSDLRFCLSLSDFVKTLVGPAFLCNKEPGG